MRYTGTRPVAKRLTTPLAHFGYNRRRFFKEGSNSMRSRSAGALGARNHVAAVLLALVASGLAFGLTLGPSPARADDEASEQARQHYQKGKQHFDLGKWDQAIVEFEEAYRLHADPNFLFNLAQAYRRKGDLQHALDLYKNYLIANPESPKRSDIKERIKTLEKELKHRPTVPPAPVVRPSEPAPAPPTVASPALEPSPKSTAEAALPQATPAATPPAPAQTATEAATVVPSRPTTPEPASPSPTAAPPVAPTASVAEVAQPAPAPETRSSGHDLRVVGIICGAAGLASIATAVFFYTRAVSLSDKVSNLNASYSDYQAGKSAESMQWVFYSVGAGALVAGSIFYYLGWSHSSTGQSATGVTPMFGPGLAGLSAQGTF
jgi:tetratricopeptide (TPR) repeat protein